MASYYYPQNHTLIVGSFGIDRRGNLPFRAILKEGEKQ
jgi:hypothetical protein